jgi:DNA repair photolyase
MPLARVLNPPNPFLASALAYDEGVVPIADLEIYEDQSQEIVAKNDSPDVGFRFSVNPYRGCMHACSYCYARPFHEYLSFGAGTDFDRKIVVKPNAPALLRRTFEKRSWTGERVVFSGVTDCYQPLEASYRLTRGCLEVCVEYKNPVGIITKAPLVERDLDLLTALTNAADLWVTVSIPIWDKEKARAIEPYVATPERRIAIIERLASEGVRVGVNIAPMIPTVSDSGMVETLERAKAAGASFAGFVFLRLPGSVKPVFEARLRETLPARADHVLALVRDARGGALYDPRFGVRQTGEGAYAEAALALFEKTAKRLGLIRDDDEGGAREPWDPPKKTFERPRAQLDLFAQK